MNKRLVIIGYWGNELTSQAINLVRKALEIYPFGEDMDKVVYTFPIREGINPDNVKPKFHITPTLVMCEGEGSIEELISDSIVLADGIDRIINWCNFHNLEEI